ncbi:MAG: RNA methyltransferase [Thermoplasmatota archaeon]
MDGEKGIPNFYIVLVEPKYSGNIGAVARAMKNFGFDNLFLVNPCILDDDCYARAKHAGDIIDKATSFTSFKQACNNLDYLVATSSIQYIKDKKSLRNPEVLEDFSEKIYEVKGNVGIVFGREDYGLFNEEIALCDIMLRIPTSEEYLSLNLSHAVCLVLYSLYIKRNCIVPNRREIGKVEKEKLFEFFSLLLQEINYPSHKKENTEILFKRLMARSMPSTWEYHTLMGVFGKTVEKMKRNQKQ